MVELTFLQPAELKALVAGREVFVWGASIVGFGLARSLERNGVAPAGFVDSSTRLQGKSSLGYPVHAPSRVHAPASAAFVVIASGHYEHEIAGECTRAGLVAGRDFISARAISPLDPSVDISGMCNLRCISCPRGNFAAQPKAGFMRADTYARVLDKILAELPFVGSVQLYAWGEPLVNPDAAEIIRLTVERRVLCAVSSNLNLRKDFSAAIRARPDWLKISVSGWGASYERTHTGGSWPLLHENLERLRRLKEEYHPEMYVEVNYHLYKHNLGDDYRRARELCEKLGFVFRANHAYLYPLDHLLAYREGREVTPAARETLDLLLLDIDQGIAKAEAQKHLPCAEERCFPIDWNGSVRFCGAYFQPVLERSFLDAPLAEIIRKRNESPFCDRCRANALHRFTSVYVEELPPDAKGRA